MPISQSLCSSQGCCFSCLFLFCIFSNVWFWEKFQLFISICRGFRSLFANHPKAFGILTGRKSCYRPGSLIREVKDAKDVVAYLIIGLKG
jgi:hypothetical protein